MPAVASPKLVWTAVGGGAYRSADGRWYLQTGSRYLGRRAGRPQTERWVAIFDQDKGGRSREAGTVREAKALCALLAAEGS